MIEALRDAVRQAAAGRPRAASSGHEHFSYGASIPEHRAASRTFCALPRSLRELFDLGRLWPWSAGCLGGGLELAASATDLAAPSAPVARDPARRVRTGRIAGAARARGLGCRSAVPTGQIVLAEDALDSVSSTTSRGPREAADVWIEQNLLLPAPRRCTCGAPCASRCGRHSARSGRRRAHYLETMHTEDAARGSRRSRETPGALAEPLRRPPPPARRAATDMPMQPAAA
jgi:hypothetical protein